MKKNKLLNNIGLKILAVLFAIVLWLIVVNISNPVISTTLTGIQVEVLNEDLITDNNKVYEIMDGTGTVSVSVTANRTILDYLNSSNMRATADMRELNEEEGTIRIRVESNRYSNQIDSLKSKTEYLKVKIEDKKSSQYPIEAVVLGEPEEGYVVGNISMNQNIVYVSGPESVVSRIHRVVTEVSVEGMPSSISTSMELKYYDADGEVIDKSRLKSNISSVDLKVEILKTKEVEITAKASGNPLNGYGLSGKIDIQPQTVVIAGKTSALNQIENIVIPESSLNVEGLTRDYSTTIELDGLLPEGIIWADTEYDGKALVKVGIVELATKTVELPKSSITITGVPETMEASFGTSSDTVAFDVMGLEEKLKTFDISQVTATVDVKGYMETSGLNSLKESSYLIPVTITLPEGIVQKIPVNINLKFKEID